MNSVTLQSTSQSFKVPLQKYALMYAQSPFKISDYSFYSPTLFIAPTRSTCPSIPLAIIYIRSAPQPLKHAHSSPLVLPQYKHFKQNNVLTFQINQPTRCNNFSSLLLDVYVQLNMFRAPSRPSSGAQQLH